MKNNTPFVNVIKIVDQQKLNGDGSKNIKDFLKELKLQERQRILNVRREKYDLSRKKAQSLDKEISRRAVTDYDQDIQQFQRDLRIADLSNNKKAYISVKNYLEMQDHQIKTIKNSYNSVQMDKLAEILQSQEGITADMLSISPSKKSQISQKNRNQRSITSNYEEFSSTKNYTSNDISRNNLSILERSPPNKYSSVNNQRSFHLQNKSIELPLINSNKYRVNTDFDFSDSGNNTRLQDLNSSMLTESTIQKPDYSTLRENMIPQIDDFFRGRTAQNFIKRARNRNQQLGDQVLKINDNKAKIIGNIFQKLFMYKLQYLLIHLFNSLVLLRKCMSYM